MFVIFLYTFHTYDKKNQIMQVADREGSIYEALIRIYAFFYATMFLLVIIAISSIGVLVIHMPIIEHDLGTVDKNLDNLIARVDKLGCSGKLDGQEHAIIYRGIEEIFEIQRKIDKALRNILDNKLIDNKITTRANAFEGWANIDSRSDEEKQKQHSDIEWIEKRVQ